MARTLALPKLGVNMTEATIVSWRVKEGDAVNEGDIVLEAETDKAIQEIPATMSGIVGKILAREGETVACQAAIAVLLEPGEALDARLPPAEPAAAGPAAAKVETRVPGSGSAVPPRPAAGKPGRLRISPLARRSAAMLGVDVGSLAPGKPGARIVRADVLSAAAKPAAIPAGPSGASSLSFEVKLDRLLDFKERFGKSYAPVSLIDLLVMILARTLKIHPLPGRGEAEPGVDIAVMVRDGKSPGVRTIRDAEAKGLARIAAELGEALPDAGQGGSVVRATLRLIDLGAYGIDGYVPAAALVARSPLLSLGEIRRFRQQADDGGEAAADFVRLTLAFDGDLVDVFSASEFLQAVKAFVEEPALLLVL